MEVLICEKESEERGKRKLLDGGMKRTPSLLNLPSTTVQPRVALNIAHYW